MERSPELNQDGTIHGRVLRSAIANPEYIEGRPEPVYFVEIEPEEPGIMCSIALMFDSYMGPYCVNREETVEQLMNSKSLRFESIHRPLADGADPLTGEFTNGTLVRVSCRLELRTGEMTADGAGNFRFPVFQMRFVDCVYEEAPKEPEKIDPELLVHYDF